MSLQADRRVLVAWCPDWPVVAAARAEGLSLKLPAAVLTGRGVVACNAVARAEGVRRGMRRRDAQARCPELVMFAADAARDARAFEPALAAVERLRPGVASLRPGLLAVRSPARFYGGDHHAAAVVAEALVEAGVWDVRTGVADDVFTAEQAARRAAIQDVVVVAAGGAADFLRDLPVEVLEPVLEAEESGAVVGLLRRLGLVTLADFAALPAGDVLTRFGAIGARVHRLARGDASSQLLTRTPPPELAVEVCFEPPLESVEAVCFSVRRTAERFVSGLADHDLVATVVRVEADGEPRTGGAALGARLSARSWAHAGCFSPVDLVDRVHWQLQTGCDGPVAAVRFLPEVVEPAAAHAETLWGSGDARVERGIAKVQAMLGYDAACRPVRQGGRSPADRQALVPWGDRVDTLRPVGLPWPGSIPPPAPTRVFAEPRPVVMLGDGGRPVVLTERGLLSGTPARFRPGGASSPEDRWQPVTAWAGPWPVYEQLQDAGTLVARFQIVASDGRAWLLRCDADSPGRPGAWFLEAGYD